MTRFGPAGASDSFRALGMKHTREAPAWLRSLGLDAFEYSAGRGVHLLDDTAREIGAAAANNGVAVSIHAPYYINLARIEPDKRESNRRWFRESANAVALMGGDRIVFHPGSPGKGGDRADAMARAADFLAEIAAMSELSGMTLCPETTGRPSQLGTVAEIAALCGVADNLIPTVDFAHLHAIERITDEDGFKRALDPLLAALGPARMRHFHAHFSHIEFGDKGERRHRNFDDEGFGPDFRPLARVLIEYRLEPVIICESAGHQSDDALTMQTIYREELSCCTGS